MDGGGPSAVAASVIWRPRLLRSWLLRFNDLSQLSFAALFIFPLPTEERSSVSNRVGIVSHLICFTFLGI